MASRDRMDAIRASVDNQEDFVSIELSDMNNGPCIDDFYKDVESLNNNIERLQNSTEEVKEIHSQILSNPQVDEDVKKRLDEITLQSKSDITTIRAKLKQMEAANNELSLKKPSSAETRIRHTQYHMLHHKFVEVVTNYQQIQAVHRERCKDRIIRQIMITNQETTEDEIEEMIEKNNPAIFYRGIMDTQQARKALAEIEARHSDIKKLEKSIQELRDIFIEMATLVDSQGEMVDRIENHVQESKSHVEKAKEEVTQAMVYQSKARMKKLICFICLILIVVAIVVTSLNV